MAAKHLLLGASLAVLAGSVSAAPFPAPTTPLAGTEIVPCIQSHGYKNCTVNNVVQNVTADFKSKSLAVSANNPIPGTGSAPLYIQNNSGDNIDGQNLGERIWIGSSPTATPAAHGAVAFTIGIDNLASRGGGGIWAFNTVCNQYSVGDGGSLSINHCQENDFTQSQAAVSPIDPLGGGGPVSHGLELEASANGTASAHNPQVALWISSAKQAGNSATDTMLYGSVVSRAEHGGYAVEDFTSDTHYGFDTGSFIDASHQSARVLYVTGGTHNNYIDISGVTSVAGSTFIHGPSGVDATLFNSNLADHTFGFTMDSGSGSGQNAYFGWSDRATEKWRAQKDPTNNLDIVNVADGKTLLSFTLHDHISMSTAAVPVITSCGTNPSAVSGSDTSFHFTTGTGSPTACTITFGQTYSANPTALVVDSSKVAQLTSYTISSSALVLTLTGTGGDIIEGHVFDVSP